MFKVYWVSDLKNPKPDLQSKWGDFISYAMIIGKESGNRIHQALKLKFNSRGHCEEPLALFFYSLKSKLPKPIGIVTGTPDFWKLIDNGKTLYVRDYKTKASKEQLRVNSEDYTQTYYMVS